MTLKSNSPIISYEEYDSDAHVLNQQITICDCSISYWSDSKNYPTNEQLLDNIPIIEIEQYLRNAKLQKIKKL